ncbi:DUF2971 domain-containing protein [Agrobacterium tumefaciens]|uniref:DUF2971 domain-containing protein n=1 Tax=Agrobacterium tumefaciens TaxID=358 RepID=UPI001573182F|nr:DUF2971 domain-containing protein [Agrobacterium tumefaciens]NSZ83436.1 DUF2971 domain-containing protein [Agrobacterium tumefaciens]WCA69647.1 DUF2971 domain-containing protein [Agrobacterium tumefaciens]
MTHVEKEKPSALKKQDEPELPPRRHHFAGAAAATLKKYAPVIPSKLYHYTSSEGLLGIISNNNFRFSDSRFLNDGSENYTAQNIAALAIESYRNDHPEVQKEVGDRLLEAIREAVNTLIPVVFCMSSQNNLLNQWRDYGKDVVPYSLEVDVSSLYDNRIYDFPVYLVKVIYDATEMIAICHDFFLGIHRAVNEIYPDGSPSPEEEDKLYEGAALEFVALSLSFKNPAFEAEQEWRLVTTTVDLRNQGVARRYRSSNLGVVPYFQWGRKDGKSLPISLVTVGPSPYSRVSDLALKEFLDDNGYECETVFSTIPIRR